jgi:hypothetical protein
LLHSPTPFLIGCAATDDLAEVDIESTVVIVDTDRRRLRTHVSFPPLPGATALAGKLRTLLAQNRSAVGFPGPLPKLFGHKIVFGEETAEAIANIVKEPLAMILSDELDGFFVTDLSAADRGVTFFNEELFRATLAPEETPFFEALLDGMTFHTYLEERLTRFADERGTGWEQMMPPMLIPTPRIMVNAD